MTIANVGDKIKIIALKADSNGEEDPAAKHYVGKIGIVKYIDSIGILHGTWGSLGILPCDTIEVLTD